MWTYLDEPGLSRAVKKTRQLAHYSRAQLSSESEQSGDNLEASGGSDVKFSKEKEKRYQHEIIQK